MKRLLICAIMLALALTGCSDDDGGGNGTASTDPTNIDDTGSPTVAAIEGVVKNTAGDPVSGAIVTVQGQDITATADDDGAFTLTDLPAGPAYLAVSDPSGVYLDSELHASVYLAEGATVTGVEIVLSGRPSDSATWVGGSSCTTGCHGGMHSDLIDGMNESAHARFVTEGTSHMVYPNLWPAPGSKYLPRDPSGNLLMAQDPADGEGLVHLVLCTDGPMQTREYIFKFYPEQPTGTSLTEAELDCALDTAGAVYIPVGGTIGGEGNWGEGYNDPSHAQPDNHPNFGEGKQRFLARIQDVPYLVSWMTANNIDVDRTRQDYVSYLPVYLVQDATPAGSDVLSGNEVGGPKFWQKAPDHWCVPENTLSRNCAGCHATGLEIEYQDVVDGEKTRKSVVTAFDYKDLNVTCERCHGPGSEHAAGGDKTKIINPRHMTANASIELCGQCHAAHSGKSSTPSGVFKYAFNGDNIDSLGNGVFVPGVHSLEDFYTNYNQPTQDNVWSEGTFHTWADDLHGRAHSQQVPELIRSIHGDNPYHKLTCATCHNPHSLAGAPEVSKIDTYEFETLGYADNSQCLSCHATHGDFEDISRDDVAALQLDAGRGVQQDGTDLTMDASAIDASKLNIASVVGEHMLTRAAMNTTTYTPEDDASPVGRCNSCHMAKIGKLFDVNDDAQYKLDYDEDGNSAVAEGNVGSHVFDIVWPAQSEALVGTDLTNGNDYDIMPNSCSKCHASARFSGDLD